METVPASKTASDFRLQRKGRAILFTPIDLFFRADFEAMVNVILFLASGMQLPHPDADEAESMLHKCSQNHDPRHLTCFLFVIPFIPVYKAFLTGMKGMKGIWQILLCAANHSSFALQSDLIPVVAQRWLKLFGHKLFFIYSARPTRSLVLVAAPAALS